MIEPLFFQDFFVNKTFEMSKGNFSGCTLAIFHQKKENKMLVIKPVVSEKTDAVLNLVWGTIMKATRLLNKY